MKKFLSLFLIVILLVPFFGCEKKQDAPYVILINTVNGIDVYDTIAAAAKLAAEDYGMNLEVTGPTADQINDIDAVYIQAMKDAIAKKPDAIICEPLTDEAKDLAAEAQAAGIAVFCTFYPAREGDYIASVGTDNADYGIQAADFLAEKTDASGKVLAVISRADVTNQQEQLKAFTDRLTEKYPGMEVFDVVEDLADTETAENVIRASLSANPEIDTVLMLEAVGGTVAAKVGKELGRELLILDIDADNDTLAAIRSGDIWATLVQNHMKNGYEIVRMAYEYLNGENQFAVGTNMESAAVLITKDEVDQVTALCSKTIRRKGTAW